MPSLKDITFYFLLIQTKCDVQIYDLDNIQKPNKKDFKELLKLLKEVKK